MRKNRNSIVAGICPQRAEIPTSRASAVCVSEFQPEFFPDQDKKLSLQPDVTATSVPACYEYPFDPKLSMSRSLSEHHYDVPHLSIAPQPSPMSPTPSTSTQESCSDKQIHSDSENSVTSSYPSSDSTYNVASESVRLPKLEAGNVARAAVNTRGALLVLPDSGISMSVPEGAVPKTHREELYLAVLNEDRFRPRLPGKCKKKKMKKKERKYKKYKKDRTLWFRRSPLKSRQRKS